MTGVQTCALPIYALLAAAVIAIPMMVWLVTTYGLTRTRLMQLVVVTTVAGTVAASIFGPYLDTHRERLFVGSGHAYLEWAEVMPGGFSFQIWDRLFGTYVAPEAEPPPIGLTGRRRLWRNPLRIALGGWLQLAGELWYNPGVATRLEILFGSARYRPPRPVYVLTRPDEPEEA